MPNNKYHGPNGEPTIWDVFNAIGNAALALVFFGGILVFIIALLYAMATR